ncbi:MAG: hypothetical protein ACYDAE_27635 [Steroidobacteraceae bacterium]
MTTYVDFQPSSTASPPFQFQATLDGGQYNVAVTWNVFGQRYYASVYDLSGNRICSVPMVGSGAKIQGVLSWADGTVTAALQAPHNVPVGAVANIEISDTGLGYDGSWRALAVDPLTLSFGLPADPGQYGVTGNASQDVNLIGNIPKSVDSSGNPLAWFSSTLIFRTGTQQFEVNP